MVPEALLDTDTLSELLKGRNASVVVAAQHCRGVHPCYTTSAVTVMEMAKGFHKAGRPDALGRLARALEQHRVLPLDRESAMLAGAIPTSLERAGLPIGRADPMVAAIAMQHGLALVTGNLEHFGRTVSLGYPLKLDTWHGVAGAGGRGCQSAD